MKKTRSLNEGLEYKCMVDMLKPTLHIDEFESKIGEDDQYVVLSFFVNNELVAKDLVQWFETGYEYVIDADKSEGEIQPNRYLVFVEIKRRTRIIGQIGEMLEDLETLTDFSIEDWEIEYEGVKYKYDPQVLSDVLILSPQTYREMKEMDLNEMRQVSGIRTKNVYETPDKDMNAYRTLANLPIKK